MSATSVDDILLASDFKAESNLTTSQLNSKFSITDSDNADWILGCRITRARSKHLLMIDQEQFVTSILRHYDMDCCNKTMMPLPAEWLTTDMCPKTEEEHAQVAVKLYSDYCAIVGKCMYLSTCTRPNISYAVRELARFMSNYGKRHYAAAKHLLCYLKGTSSHGIIYGDIEQSTPIFCSFADSDWAASQNQRSISGYLVECGSGPIAWSSKQQTLVALSSCEAKYISCTHCTRQIIWLRSLFHELGFSQDHASALFCDNQGTVACTHNPHSHSLMKHINLHAHFIRDCINRRVIDVHHILGMQNPADLLTKSLPNVTHLKWLHMIRLDIDQNSSQIQVA
jgi:hypothetical protein